MGQIILLIRRLLIDPFSSVKDRKIRCALKDTAKSMKNNPFVESYMFLHKVDYELEPRVDYVPEFIKDPTKRDNTGEPEVDAVGFYTNLGNAWEAPK